MPVPRVWMVGAAALAGCGAHATTAPTGAVAALPGCIRAEGSDNSQEFTFDVEGNLTGHVERDRAGTQLSRTSLTWLAGEIVVDRTGAIALAQRGTFGAHGELLAWNSKLEDVTLQWAGTFDPVRSPAATRFAFETSYHFIGLEPLLPVDTTWRSVSPRMRAFAFTGTVVLHRGSAPESEDVHARYEGGHQIEVSDSSVVRANIWRGNELIEQTDSHAGTTTFHRTLTWSHGKLTHITGMPDTVLRYGSNGQISSIRSDYDGVIAEAAISSCAR